VTRASRRALIIGFCSFDVYATQSELNAQAVYATQSELNAQAVWFVML
jgi:hypothetical protein